MADVIEKENKMAAAGTAWFDCKRKQDGGGRHNMILL
jgi:hypothetical protein